MQTSNKRSLRTAYQDDLDADCRRKGKAKVTVRRESRSRMKAELRSFVADLN